MTSLDYTDCRDRGHAWMLPRELPTLGDERQGFILSRVDVERTLVCWRCDTERHEVFSRRGVRLKHPRYYYPDGYLNRGEGRRGRDEYRTLAIKAALKALRKGQ